MNDATSESYWRSFYDGRKAPSFPSQFAVFVKSWLGDERPTILEVGAGNGRDAGFFISQGHRIVAYDQVIGKGLQEAIEGIDAADLASAVSGSVDVTTVEPPAGMGSEAVVLYSRFFQHAIPQDIEDQMLANIGAWLPVGSMAFFEFRVHGDKELPKTFGGHYRRFQTADDFCSRVVRHGFSQRYAVTGTGYARYRDEDPVVGRFVFEKTS